jgi:hypothetical protein
MQTSWRSLAARPPAAMGDVFEATAKAILDYNGGQGGLALEELANIARAPIELELVSDEDIAGRNIREVVCELLNELAERREQARQRRATPGVVEHDDTCALDTLAIPLERSKGERGASSSREIVDAAHVFYAFIHKARAASDEGARFNALACREQRVDWREPRDNVRLVAEDFSASSNRRRLMRRPATRSTAASAARRAARPKRSSDQHPPLRSSTASASGGGRTSLRCAGKGAHRFRPPTQQRQRLRGRREREHGRRSAGTSRRGGSRAPASIPQRRLKRGRA